MLPETASQAVWLRREVGTWEADTQQICFNSDGDDFLTDTATDDAPAAELLALSSVKSVGYDHDEPTQFALVMRGGERCVFAAPDSETATEWAIGLRYVLLRLQAPYVSGPHSIYRDMALT